MQTFMPYPEFDKSASVLDPKRLGKQRVECLQIMKALLLPEYGWKSHPAVKMWEGHTTHLFDYSLAICDEWKSRGCADTCAGKLFDLFRSVRGHACFEDDLPFWLGRDEFHSSHRSALLRKDPVHYSAFGWTDDPTIPYWWPTDHA